MHPVMKTHQLLFLSGLVLCLSMACYLVFGPTKTRIVTDALLVGSALVVTLAWRKVAFRKLRFGIQDGAANLIVSTWLVWSVLLSYFIWLVIFAALDRPDYLRLSPIPLLFDTLFFLSAAYAILVPVSVTELIPRPPLRSLVIYVVIGLAVAVGLSFAALSGLISYGGSS